MDNTICLECGVHKFSLYCEDCEEEFCETCFQFLHKNGNRKLHVMIDMTNESEAVYTKGDRNEDKGSSLNRSGSDLIKSILPTNFFSGSNEPSSIKSNGKLVHLSKFIPLRLSFEERKMLRIVSVIFNMSHYTDTVDNYEHNMSLSMHRPTNLSDQQRKVNLLKANINVEFPAKKIQLILKQIHNILIGIICCHNIEIAAKLMESSEYSQYVPFFRTSFEILRRYKILNPEKMKGSYAKLLYFLQDTNLKQVKDIISFESDSNDKDDLEVVGRKKVCPEYMQENKGLVKDVSFVYRALHDNDPRLLSMLSDSDTKKATKAIIPEKFKSSKTKRKSECITAKGIQIARKKTSQELKQEKDDKSKAIKSIVRKYRSHSLTVDQIENILYSIGDYNSFLVENSHPIKYLLGYLRHYFNPYKAEEGLSLAIMEEKGAGQFGPRLNHTHGTQYQYIFQTLTLWREILTHYYELWYYAEQDLINSSFGYELANTGQGMQRIQHSPRTLSFMQKLILQTQKKVGNEMFNNASPIIKEEESDRNDFISYDWVGSSVIHIGDNNVPNALIFIDKYTQISKILNPIIKTLINLPDNVAKYPDFEYFITSRYGSIESCQKHILCDFFKHGFDGSGADNFFDAGSCIDGRLTSAWNWCSLISSKEFYPCFKLCGFLGFDGEY